MNLRSPWVDGGMRFDPTPNPSPCQDPLGGDRPTDPGLLAKLS